MCGSLPDLAEIYYVLAGDGTVTVGAETAPIRSGDALAIRLNESQSFTATGSAGLELLIVGVSRTLGKTALTRAEHDERPPGRQGELTDERPCRNHGNQNGCRGSGVCGAQPPAITGASMTYRLVAATALVLASPLWRSMASLESTTRRPWCGTTASSTPTGPAPVCPS